MKSEDSRYARPSQGSWSSLENNFAALDMLVIEFIIVNLHGRGLHPATNAMALIKDCDLRTWKFTGQVERGAETCNSTTQNGNVGNIRISVR